MADARVVRSLLAALAALAVELGAAGSREARAQTPHADFNGDDFDDIAVGVPLEDVGPASDAGAVNVVYGSAGGLTDRRDQLWTQESFGVFDAAEMGDHFGEALAAGDFNGDGFDDLAVGACREDLGSAFDAGAVNVIYGSPSGLTSSGGQLWTQDTPGVADSSEADDRLCNVAAGDLNGDGFDDLAIAALRESVGTKTAAGAVNVIYGSASGLTDVGNQLWTQDSPRILGRTQKGDEFGVALTIADLNGDGFDDLAVGVPYEDVGTAADAGGVNVIYGSAAGLTDAGNQLWTQDSPGIAGAAEEDDALGLALAAGDFDGDGFGDLAASAVFDDVAPATDAGAVNVIYGSAAGLTDAGNQLWSQNSPGILDAADNADILGASLEAADFDGDGFADLAAAAGDENVGTIPDAGAVNVIYGSATGLVAAANQLWHQNTPGIADKAESFDEYGAFGLCAGDYNGDGAADLAVNVPEEDVGSVVDAGAVNVIYGSAAGLTDAGNQLWTQNSPGILDTVEEGDLFGAGLASGVH